MHCILLYMLMSYYHITSTTLRIHIFADSNCLRLPLPLSCSHHPKKIWADFWLLWLGWHMVVLCFWRSPQAKDSVLWEPADVCSAAQPESIGVIHHLIWRPLHLPSNLPAQPTSRGSRVTHYNAQWCKSYDEQYWIICFLQMSHAPVVRQREFLGSRPFCWPCWSLAPFLQELGWSRLSSKPLWNFDAKKQEIWPSTNANSAWAPSAHASKHFKSFKGSAQHCKKINAHDAHGL